MNQGFENSPRQWAAGHGDGFRAGGLSTATVAPCSYALYAPSGSTVAFTGFPTLGVGT